MRDIKVGVISLGCSKNRVDTEYMMGVLRERGFSFVSQPGEADALIINTCGFITEAKQESVNTILEMAGYKKSGKLKALVVTGCLSQRYGEELACELPEVDAFLGAHNLSKIADALLRALDGERVVDFRGLAAAPDYSKRLLTTPDYMAYVKIAEGCSNRCSYCAIPLIRGPLKSRMMDEVMGELKALAGRGVKEVVLVAQDTTKYGADIYGKNMLEALLARMREINGFEWIRVLYCYPENITRSLIDVMLSDERICKYIDMPIQHINDEILKAMNRTVTREQIYAAVDMIRKTDPDFVIRTTLMTGFPTETPEQHKELMTAVADLSFDHAGVFAYSQEDGTKAADMPQIDEETKKERYNELMRSQARVSYRRNEKRIGHRYKVVVEGYDGVLKRYFGRSYAEAPEVDGKIFINGAQSLEIGGFVEVEIEKAYDYDLSGAIVR